MTIVTRSGRVCNRVDEYYERKKKNKEAANIKRLKKRRYRNRYHRGYSSFRCKPGDSYWIKAEKIVNDIVQKYKRKMEKPPVGPVVVKKLRVDIASGYMFNVDFEVTGEDGSISDYFAEAWVMAGAGKVVNQCLEKVIFPGSSKTKRKVVTLFTIKPPVKLHESVFDGIDKDSIESLFGKKNSRLRTLGYNILLKKKKKLFPGCTPYARVRKAVTHEWARMGEPQRLGYMTEAALKLKEKWLQEKKDPQ